jgi:von Willebrand factor type A C-terminal domain
VLPVKAAGSPWRAALDDLVRRDDQVDAEVMLGLWQGSADDLQRVHSRHDDGARADESGFLQERDLDICVACALPEPGAVPIHRHAAADHQVNRLHAIDADLSGRPCGSVFRCGPGRRLGEGAGIENVEGQLAGEHGDSHVEQFVVSQGPFADRLLGCVRAGLNNVCGLPHGQSGEPFRRRLGSREGRDVPVNPRLHGALAFQQVPHLGAEGVCVQVPPAAVGQEMLAARVSLVVGTPSGQRALGQGMVRAIWTDDEALSTRINPHVAHYTGQAELAQVIQEGLEARKEGDEDTATAKLGRAVALAQQSGNEDTAKLLAKVVDVVDAATGTVRLKKKVQEADEMTLDTRSTKTVRTRK